MKHSGMKVKQLLGADGNPIVSSLGQAYGWLKGLKARLKKKAKAEEFPVTSASHSERLRFLMYGVNLLNPMDYPKNKRGQIIFYKNLLTAMAQGYSKQWIAKMSGCSLETLEKHESEAKKYVQDAILRAQKHGTPIIGGK